MVDIEKEYKQPCVKTIQYTRFGVFCTVNNSVHLAYFVYLIEPVMQ